MPMEIKGGVITPASVTCQTCALNPNCQFDLKRRGGFKGTRPHYVGYRLITDAIEGHAAKEDSIRCFDFVEVLQGRMNTGRAQREQGKDGEIISIIAQEGEPIERRTSVAVTSLGEVVRPQAEIVDDLIKAGYKIASDHAQSVTRKEVTYKTLVPSFEEEGRRINSYSQLLLARESALQDAEGDAEETAWAEAKARMAKADAAEETAFEMGETPKRGKNAKE